MASSALNELSISVTTRALLQSHSQNLNSSFKRTLKIFKPLLISSRISLEKLSILVKSGLKLSITLPAPLIHPGKI